MCACNNCVPPMAHTDHNNQPHQYCLVTYYLPTGFSPKMLPHGNSKTAKPFYPTLPSVMDEIKEECNRGSGPKKVIATVSAGVGGVISATDACELPRDEQQVTKLKSRMKSSSSTASGPGGKDVFSIIMQQAFLEEGKSSFFIRDVKCLREPAVVVATERQLNDLVRFCTCPADFSVLTVDPTFCLGEFDVTVITYRHMLLTSRQSQQYPALIGPVLIHYKKTFATYLFFIDSLIGMRRELSSVMCFGTDGETALIDAFQHAMPNRLHLLCSIHVRRNVKSKLQEVGISEKVRNVILADIFGKKCGSHYEEGLTDSSAEKMYDRVFNALVKKWEKLDVAENVLQKFVSWFKVNKESVIKKCMLKPVREKAGLGKPPTAFTTNASESINALIKKKVDYKRNELPVFLKELKEAIDEQDNEISRALIGRGKYTVRSELKRFQKTETQWFTKMKESERIHHIQKFSSATLSVSKKGSSAGRSSAGRSETAQNLVSDEPSCSYEPSCSTYEPSSSCGPSCLTYEPSRSSEPFNSSSSEDEPSDRKKVKRQLVFPSLSIAVEDFSESVTVPTTVLDGIWEKACTLLNTHNAIAVAPGLDVKSHSVMSYSGNRPHIVSVKSTGQHVCDKSCGNWNSLGICAHTVAVAEVNCELSRFVSWFCKDKKKPSLTKLILTGMPEGTGRKGGKSAPQRRKRQPTESRTSISVLSGIAPCVTVDDSSQQATPTTQQLPSRPPPLVHYTPQMAQSSSQASDEPFTLCFISGNIGVCYGCRQKYPKPCKPPDDLCVRHKEWREFFSPGAALPQTKYSNAYYHCNVPCIQSRCPFFTPDLLVIPANIAMQLLPIHTAFLFEHMPRSSQ